MSISERAVLVKLNISTWTANKLDKVQTNSVNEKHHAERNAAQVRKNLMAGTTYVKQIKDYAAACRLEHTETTLAWEDRGFRVLPTSLVLDYKARINYQHKRFDLLVGEFLRNYHAQIQQAKQALGSLFDPSDYPSVDQVRSKYEFKAVFRPIPSSGHFFIDIPQQDLEEMKASVDDEVKQQTAEAMHGAWERLHNVLKGMSEKLTEPKDPDAKKRWHESFITNPADLCSVLKHLNITNDPKLTLACNDLEATLAGVELNDVKESALERLQMKTKVDDILKQYEWGE